MENIVFGVMTTFFPTRSAVNNAKTIAKQCYSLVIVDDTGLESDERDSAIFNELKNIENIVILENEKNSGIAFSLNVGIQYSIDNGADYIVTFDDDTQICHCYVQQCLDFYLRNTDEVGAVSLSRGRLFVDGKAPAISKKTLITSGFFTSAKLYKNNDLIPDDYFIDLVDFYVSFKIRSLGYKTYILDRVGMIHSVGNITSRRVFFDFNIYNHAPFRLYYQVRNCILFFRDFWRFDYLFCCYLLLDVARIPLKALFFEDDKISRLTYCLKGLYHGILRRKGKLNE